jgi:hypothetical protein
VGLASSVFAVDIPKDALIIGVLVSFFRLEYVLAIIPVENDIFLVGNSIHIGANVNIAPTSSFHE